jgi:hypothetical protein
MPKEDRNAAFNSILDEMKVLHAKKGEDYGTDEDDLANVRAAKAFGVPPWVGAMIRLNDKIVRLQQFAKRGSLANEGAEDSMIDIAVYAIIALQLYREESKGTYFPIKDTDLESRW